MEVPAVGHILVAEVLKEGGLAGNLALLGGLLRLGWLGLALGGSQAVAPTGQVGLSALPHHVLQVELAVGGLVVGEIAGEIMEHAEEAELLTHAGDEHGGGEAARLLVDGLVGLGDGEEADEVVVDDLLGNGLVVHGVDEVEGDGGTEEALVGVFEGSGPLGG